MVSVADGKEKINAKESREDRTTTDERARGYL